MEDYVKSKLKTLTFNKLESVSGCINRGVIYNTDYGKVFVKYNSCPEANIMFSGEFEALKEILKTQTVKVPKPLIVGNKGKEYFIAMEYFDMSSLRKYSSRLGELLAEMHMNNINSIKYRKKFQQFITGKKNTVIENFGFHIQTACGELVQNNGWESDWVNFYTKQKLQHQIDLIAKNYGNREALELWSHLQLKIPFFFKNLNILPSLLHGDLWIGNAGETDQEPVCFDPASFYGHHEYDLAIAAMFGGFGKKFFDSYHQIIPKINGFHQRHQLYVLFHHLNHWNHFGSHKESSLRIMRNLIKENVQN